MNDGFEWPGNSEGKVVTSGVLLPRLYPTIKNSPPVTPERQLCCSLCRYISPVPFQSTNNYHSCWEHGIRSALPVKPVLTAKSSRWQFIGLNGCILPPHLFASLLAVPPNWPLRSIHLAVLVRRTDASALYENMQFQTIQVKYQYSKTSPLPP
ncbi:hypothetical protein VTK56DRAFT_9629 [Thermocarpiscus australiensis]